MTHDKVQHYSIFVTGDALDRERLNSTVASFVKIYIDGDSLEIVFTPEGNKLTVRQKLLVLLLVRKILADTEHIEEEAITPGDLENETGIPGGTIRPTLAKLLDTRLVAKAKTGGGYYVPNYSLESVSQEIMKNGGES